MDELDMLLAELDATARGSGARVVPFQAAEDAAGEEGLPRSRQVVYESALRSSLECEPLAVPRRAKLVPEGACATQEDLDHLVLSLSLSLSL
ncbi:hypothetical protein Pelo_19638 [Pelomyxa schiedti]|nr:hypothetical protein Pelo_19638 [Pelomyxa schiedti]